MQETQEGRVLSLGWEDLLEEDMATYYNIPAWRVPWAEEPAGLHSMGSHRSDTPEVTEHTRSLVLRERPICHEGGIKPGTLMAASSNGVLSAIQSELSLNFVCSVLPSCMASGYSLSCSWTIVS